MSHVGQRYSYDKFMTSRSQITRRNCRRRGKNILGDSGADSGGKETTKRAEKNTFLRAIFFRPFRLSLAPNICPWVSKDGKKLSKISAWNFTPCVPRPCCACVVLDKGATAAISPPVSKLKESYSFPSTWKCFSLIFASWKTRNNACNHISTPGPTLSTPLKNTVLIDRLPLTPISDLAQSVSRVFCTQWEIHLSRLNETCRIFSNSFVSSAGCFCHSLVRWNSSENFAVSKRE